MISITNVEKIFSLVILTGVYFFSVILSGFAEAWTAKRFGDDTPERLGFFSLNPMAHLDLFGFLILLCSMTFGWGKDIPVNPHNLGGRNRFLSLIMIYGSKIAINIFISLVALIIFTYTFIGATACSPQFGKSMLLSYFVPLQAFTNLFPGHFSLTLIAGMFLVRLILFNSILVAINLPLKMIHIACTYLGENSWQYNKYSPLINNSILFFTLFFFGNSITHVLLNLIVFTVKILIL